MRTLIVSTLLLLAATSLASTARPAPATSVASTAGDSTGEPSGTSTARPDPQLLARMIGDWDVDYEIDAESGDVKHYLGTARYQWILDGAAIQEIWTSDYHGRKAQPYGTTIEFYDGKRQRWTAMWIFPEKGAYFAVSGGETGGRIVLSGNDQDGVLQRWSTGDFRKDSFTGRFETSKDGGKTWRLVGVNHMQRHETR